MADLLSDIGNKVKGVAGAVDNMTRLKKRTKLEASYVEYEKFSDSNLHEGYFCYNCIYWASADGGRCMLVEHDGPDVDGQKSGVIAPHGCCQAYDANYDKLHDTRAAGEGVAQDTEKNSKKVTTADVV